MSPKFTDASSLWQPVIAKQYKTPREIKRFLNRVRYITMRGRKIPHELSPAERLAEWVLSQLRRTPALDPPPAEQVDEAAIVAMAAQDGLEKNEATMEGVNSMPSIIRSA